MRGRRADGWARVLGGCLGAALALTALANARVPPAGGALGLDLTVAASPSGELGIDPPGPALAVTGMRPGSVPAKGSFAIRNQTGRVRAFRLRALPSIPDVDRALRLRAVSGRTVLYDGTLGGLREWTTTRVELRSGETAAVSLRAWLAPGATRWAGRVADVPLELSAEPAP